MIKVVCIYPTILENGGYIDRDEVVSITEAQTHEARIQRNFRLPDGSKIAPVTLTKEAAAADAETATEFDADILGLLTLTKDDLIRKAQTLGLATSARMSKETIARLIVESGVPPAFN